MFERVPESTMHRVRWGLTIAWFVLIASLFYDPLTPVFTQPESVWSPLRLSPALLDPELCAAVLTVQGECVPEQPYAIGAKVFWGMVIPAAVLVLPVLGHEFWRRICPLSFISQLPRRLQWQRQRPIVHPKTGKVRYAPQKVAANSWLGRNHLYLQFGILSLGLCARILFVNSNRVLLGGLFLLTIAVALAIGYLFAGKSWCQYFCPMAPVQKFYTGPGSLLGSRASSGSKGSKGSKAAKRSVTQSMCRQVTPEGREKSACVACQSACIDIDAERSYWQIMDSPGRRFVHYGYVGSIVGFYAYYFLYSGTLDYYYSGAWSHEEHQLQALFAPGWYIAGQAIAIPKLLAAPLTIAAGILLGYGLFTAIEVLYRSARSRFDRPISERGAQHQIFAIATFLGFNVYFSFGGRDTLRLLPGWAELGFDVAIVLLSTLWLCRTIGRTPEAYRRDRSG